MSSSTNGVADSSGCAGIFTARARPPPGAAGALDPGQAARPLQQKAPPRRAADELATRLALRSFGRCRSLQHSKPPNSSGSILARHAHSPRGYSSCPAVGPIVAAQLIVSWSHRDRFGSDTRFARLAGVAPVPASSGQTTRYRLSRGGDRQLNRALHTIVLHRRHHDPTTRDYIAKRIAEGKSRRDATRLLKRYLARHLYRLLENQEPPMT